MTSSANVDTVKTGAKVHYLDGIRGIAAFMVVLHHFLLAFYPSTYYGIASPTHLNNWDTKYGQSIFSVLTNGNFCVCIFFVLSGYVLSRKYFYTNSFDMLISAAQRRYLRLYIPISATLLLSYLLIITGINHSLPVSALTHAGQLKSLLKSLSYSVMLRGDSTFNGCLWTMSIELFGSLFVFAILALTHRTNNKLFSLIAILIACMFVSEAYMCAFVLGITLNYVAIYKNGMNRFSIFIIAIILIPSGLFLGSFPSNYELKNTVFEHIPFQRHLNNPWLHVLGSYFVIFSIVIAPPVQRFFSRGIFRFLGFISFSLYLLHALVIGSLSGFFFSFLLSHFQYNIAVLIVFIFTVPISFILSYLMAKYVDTWGIKHAKIFYERWIKEKKTAQDTV